MPTIRKKRLNYRRMRFSLKVVSLVAIVAAIEFYPVLLGKIPLPIGKANQFLVYESVLPPEERRDASADIGDLVTQFYPWHAFAGESVRSGTLPLWNPHILGGTPFQAAQSGLFYPPNFVFYVFPAPWAWTLLILLQTLLPGFFTALYVRSIGGAVWSAAIAGLIFSFSGFMSGWRGFGIEDAALWLPLILWCVDRLHRQTSMRSLAIMATALAMPLLAAHPETAAHVYLVAGAYTLFSMTGIGRLRFSSMFVAAVLLAVVLAAIQVLPTLEWIGYVARSVDQQWPGRPKHERIAVLSRDMFSSPNAEGIHIPEGAAYAGMLTLLLAAWSPLERKHRSVAVFWAVAVLVSAAVVYEIQPFYGIFGKLPLVGGVKNNRLLLVVDYGLAILAALGMSSAWDDDRFRKNALLRWVSLIIAAAVCLFFLGSVQHPLIPTILLLAGFAVMSLRLLGWMGCRPFFIACAGLIAIDLLTAMHHYLPFFPVRTVFPATPTFEFVREKTRAGSHRVVGLGVAYAYNAEMMYDLSTVSGVDVPLIRSRIFFFDYIRDNENGFYFLPDKIVGLRDRRLDLMDVRYLIAETGRPSELLETQPSRFVPVFQDRSIRVFENRSAMDRAFFVPATGAEVITDDLAALERLRDPSFDPAKSVILPEALPLPGTAPSTVSSRVYNFSQTTNEIRVRADAGEPGILVVSETNFNGWRAEVDGKPGRLLLADTALIGVPLEPGSHSITLTYSPLSFRIGALISIVSLVSLAVVLWLQSPKLTDGSDMGFRRSHV